MSDIEDLEFPKRGYTHNDDPIPLKSVGYYSNDTQLFAALHQALAADEWEEIAESSLGVCLKFNRLEFGWASRLVHFILALQLECKRKYEIWSLIGLTPVRFSLHEFEEFTELNCDYVPDLELEEIEVTEEMTAFWDNLGLGVDTAPSIFDLRRACTYAHQWSREDRIRLGYLAVYARFIEARSSGTPVHLNLARLVMDLEAFQRYPWGRLAFKNLIESVKGLNLNKAYHIEGFVEVLQIWVYRAMPDFAAVYGQMIPGRPTPPLLAYKGSRGRKYVKQNMLKQARFRIMVMKGRDVAYPLWDGDDEDDPLVENIIRAVYGELGKGQWRWQKKHWRLEGVLHNTQPKRWKREDNGSVCSDDESRKKSKTEGSSQASQGDSFVDSIKHHFELCIRAISTEIYLGFDKVEAELKVLSEKVEAVEEKMESVTQGAVPKSKGGEEQVKSNGAELPNRTKEDNAAESVFVPGQASVQFVEKNETPEQQMAFYLAKQEKVRESARKVLRAKSERLRKLSASQRPPYVGNSTVKVIIPNRKRPGYDPFAPVDKEKVKAIIDYLKLDPTYPKRTKGSSHHWFYTLRCPTNWLSDTHMDAGMALLRRRILRKPQWFRSERISFVDTLLHTMWKSKFPRFLQSPASDKLLPNGAYSYCLGEEFNGCKTEKTWVLEVDDVYGPLHITGDHWVAMWICFPNRHIVIWDSIIHHASRSQIAQAVEPIAVMMPYLIRECHDDDKERFSLAPFTHERIEDGSVPQNKKSGDCGVYALKYIECHALGMSFPTTLCDTNIRGIRDKLAADIFEETDLRGKDREDWDVIDMYD